jgi:energy-coupling factor transporter ATP-binding protein EcfA2
MKIVKLEIENARGIPDGTYQFVRSGAVAEDRVTVIAGPRGCGKTSLLEAVVFAKEQAGGYGPPGRPESFLRPGASSGRISAVFRFDDDERTSAELEEPELTVSVELRPDAPPIDVQPGARAILSRFSRDPKESKVEYFPDNRGLDHAGEATTLEQEKRLRATRSPRKYAGLVAGLEARSTLDGARALQEAGGRGLLFADDTPDSMGPYRYALGRLCPEVHVVGVAPHNGAPRLVLALKSGPTVTADALSGGQKQGLLFSATIVSLGLARSLILVDQPELGLHEVDHEPFFRALVALAPGAQWIVATGSSAVVRCVGRPQTITLSPSTGASR